MNRAVGPLAPQRWREAQVPLLFKQPDMLKNEEIPKQSFKNDNILLIFTFNSSTLKIITQYHCIILHSKIQDVFFKH